MSFTAFEILTADELNAEFAAIKPNVVVFTSSGTWTKPAGLKVARVRLVGGGGSGGGAAATGAGTAAEAGGGGGGGYAEKFIAAAALGATETVTIGAGGAAAAAGGAGNAGGTTSFGAHCSGSGGAGGTAGAAGASGYSAGGAGGTGTSGDINLPGERGVNGTVNATAVVNRLTAGGASQLSSQSHIAVSTSTIGAAGVNYGGGSTGALNGVSQAAIGSTAGAPGIVIVEQYF